MPHYQLFDYFEKTYEVQAGHCAAEVGPGCRCVGSDTPQERVVCSNEKPISYAKLGRRVIDELRLKPKVEEVIRHSCPQFAENRLSQAGRSTKSIEGDPNSL